MLTITVPGSEFYDEVKNEFVATSTKTIDLEHSLVSISKWESKWQKPFLSTKEKTREEVIDYIRCMTLTTNVDPNLYYNLPRGAMKEISEYIDSPMTATTFNDKNRKKSREIVTSEIIYYWMIAAQVPFECQYWHLNRLLTLIKVCGIKSSEGKKMSKRDVLNQNRALNAARKASLGTHG